MDFQLDIAKKEKIYGCRTYQKGSSIWYQRARNFDRLVGRYPGESKIDGCVSQTLGYAFLMRKKKIDKTVVDAVEVELIEDPFANLTPLATRVNARLSRSDLTRQNMSKAIDFIPLKPFRDAILQKIEKGEAHYAENYLRQEMMQKGRSDVG